MKSKIDLELELTKLKQELAALPVITSRGMTEAYRNNGGDVYGGGQEIVTKGYADPEKARSLQERIDDLEDQIINYEKYQENAENFKAGMRTAAKNKAIDSHAKTLYEQAIKEYENKGFVGKAFSILTGKKPKALASKEIVSQYGQQAEQVYEDERLININIARRQQIASIEAKTDLTPEQKIKWIASTNEYYDDLLQKSGLVNETPGTRK